MNQIELIAMLQLLLTILLAAITAFNFAMAKQLNRMASKLTDEQSLSIIKYLKDLRLDA